MRDPRSAKRRWGAELIPAGVILAALVAGGAVLMLRDGTPQAPVEVAQPVPETTPDQAGAGPSGDQAAAETAAGSRQTPLEDGAPAGVEGSPPDATAQETETAAADAPSTPAPRESPAAPQPPTIDEVRVETGGLVVVAGRAEPGSRVDVLVDGEVVGTTDTDESGAFAALGAITPRDGASSLTLRASEGGTVTPSAEEIILAPVRPAPDETRPVTEEPIAAAEEGASGSASVTEPVSPPGGADVASAPVTDPDGDAAGVEMSAAEDAASVETSPAEDVAAALPDPAEDVAAALPDPSEEAGGVATAEAVPDPTGDIVAAAPAATEDAAPEATEPEPGQEIALLRSDDIGVTLLQTSPEAPDRVVLDTIGYSDSGAVQLSGRASAEAVEIRAYVNNRPVARLPVAGDGGWRGELPEIDPGVYTLRIDALTADGSVASRVETPFKREEPAVLAAAEGRFGAGPARAITVQTGDTLWAIARERYGEGVLYVQVFEANRALIRDPDLIYPGQVFDLPAD